MYFCNTRNIYIPNMRIVFIYVIVMKAVLSNGFAFCLMWNVLENGYLEPHANTRIDFHRERGKVRQGGRQTWPYLAMAELKFCSEGSMDQS